MYVYDFVFSTQSQSKKKERKGGLQGGLPLEENKRKTSLIIDTYLDALHTPIVTTTQGNYSYATLSTFPLVSSLSRGSSSSSTPKPLPKSLVTNQAIIPLVLHHSLYPELFRLSIIKGPALNAASSGQAHTSSAAPSARRFLTSSLDSSLEQRRPAQSGVRASSLLRLSHGTSFARTSQPPSLWTVI